MDEFPGNSRRPIVPGNPDKTPSIEEKPKLDKVITGEAIKRRKPLGRRMMDTFFAKDSTSVVGYLAKEVLLPALQNLITDFVTQGIEKAVYGEVRTHPVRGSFRGSSMPRTHVSYDRPSPTIGRPPASYSAAPLRRPVTQPSAIDIGEVILGSLNDAQNVARRLDETMQEYGSVSVANLNDLIGQTSLYTDNKWGWMDLSEMGLKRVRAGYQLILPDPEDLDHR